MKKLLITSLFGVMLTVAVPALACPFGAGPGFGEPGERLDQMQERLGLSDEQRTVIEEIFDAHLEARPCKDLDSVEERQSCRLSERDKIREEIDSVLTPEQQEQLANWRKGERRRYMRGNKGSQSQKGSGQGARRGRRSGANF